MARSLDHRSGDAVIFLHDRRIPGSRANIDHIAVAPTGVWVIDTKRYKGTITVQRPLLGQAKLKIAGRDQTRLLHGVQYQASLVSTVLAQASPTVTVVPVLCFVEADLPLAGLGPVGGVELLRPKAMAKRLRAARGDGDMDAAREIAARLRASFPGA